MMMPPTIEIGAETIIAKAMNLRDIVGGARDQRRRSELRHLSSRKRPDPMKDVGPQITAQAHCRTGAEIHRRDRGSNLDQADQQHPPTGLHDVGGIALGNTMIDDVGVQGRQVQRGNGADELQHDHNHERCPVTPRVLAEQTKKHACSFQTSVRSKRGRFKYTAR
jgi:hypothetical protein